VRYQKALVLWQTKVSLWCFSADRWEACLQAAAGDQKGSDVLQAAGGATQGDWVLSWSDDQSEGRRGWTMQSLWTSFSFQ